MDLDQLKQKATQCRAAGYNCSQTMILTFKDALPQIKDLDELAFTGFGGGFAGTGRVCGAVVGATALISALKMDKNRPTYKDEVKSTLHSLYKDFEAKYQSLDCRGILSLNFMADGVKKDRCYADRHSLVWDPLILFVVELVYNHAGLDKA